MTPRGNKIMLLATEIANKPETIKAANSKAGLVVNGETPKTGKVYRLTVKSLGAKDERGNDLYTAKCEWGGINSGLDSYGVKPKTGTFHKVGRGNISSMLQKGYTVNVGGESYTPPPKVSK